MTEHKGDLSDELIKGIFVESTLVLFPRPGDFSCLSARNIRDFARAILSEGTASLKEENERLRADLEARARRYSALYKLAARTAKALHRPGRGRPPMWLLDSLRDDLLSAIGGHLEFVDGSWQVFVDVPKEPT